MPGPTAHEPVNTFAWGRYKGFSPSMSRDDMSFPAVYPTISRLRLTTRVSSGSGTLHVASARTRTIIPCPTARRPVDLKNSSGRSAS